MYILAIPSTAAFLIIGIIFLRDSYAKKTNL